MAFLTDETEIVTGLPIKAEHVKNLYDALSGDISVDIQVDGEIQANILELSNGGSIGPNLENAIDAVASGFSGSAGDGITFTGSDPTVISADLGDGLEIFSGQIRANIDAGGGLAFDNGELAVNVSDFAGNGLEDDGSGNLQIDQNAIVVDNTTVEDDGGSPNPTINVVNGASPGDTPSYTVSLRNNITVTELTASSLITTPKINVDEISTNSNSYIDITTGGERAMRLNRSGREVVVGNPNSSIYDLLVTGDVEFNYTSDINQKTNIERVKNASEILNSINGYRFDWKNDIRQQRIGTSYGVIAQEIEKVMPESVKIRADNKKAVNYDHLFAVLIEGYKEQKKEIERLKEKINA